MAVHTFYEEPVTIVLLLITLIILISGIIIHIIRWGHGSPYQFFTLWKREAFREGRTVFMRTFLFDVLLFRRTWKRSKRRWAMHMMIFWSFLFLGVCILLSLISIVLAWIDPEGFGGIFAQRLSDLHAPYDLIGYLLLIGSGFAIGRRIFVKKIRMRSKPSDFFLVLIVFSITLSGMIAEWFSGLGSVIGKAILNWDVAMLWMELHIYLAFLLFVMVLPWSRFKHILTVPLILLARRGGE